MASIGGAGGAGEAGGIPGSGAAWFPEHGRRRDLPGPLRAALVLVHALFLITVVGGLGLLLTASSYDALDGGVLALTAYGAAPGVLGWWLARRSREGGSRTWAGLIAVQAWLVLGAVDNIVQGSSRGCVQLFLPVLILYFLTRPDSRAWYRLPEPDRRERRPFSLARMIRRRRDEGQTAVEYAGLVAVVAAIIAALVVSGLGTRIHAGVQAQVCKVTGMGCAAPAGDGTDVTAGDGPKTDPGSGPGSGSDGDDGDGGDKTEAGDGDAPKTDDGCFSGFGAFLGCAGDQVEQVGEGLFVDGIGGDLKGVWDTVSSPLDTLEGLKDYGGTIADQWSEGTREAGDKWARGDYLDALTDWGGATVDSGVKILDDMFVGDEVRDHWDKGDKTRAATTVVWNVGSLFIPGYGEAKVAGKLGKLGKLGALGKLTDEAAEAAERARKAAGTGDVEGARKAAREADEAADEAERKARESGCTIAAPARRAPYGGGPHLGGPGTGTTVLALTAATSPYVVLADDGCDEEAREQAKQAREQAEAAGKAADEAGKKADGAHGGKPANEWRARDDIAGPARGKTLKFPNKRHTVSGSAGGQVKERNTVILRGNEDLVRADIEGIANGRATLSPDGNTYEINGRTYEVEGNGTVFPKSGPGLVEMDRIEYAALKEIARNKGDIGKSQQLQRDPKFVDNPAKVQKAKQIYDGTYK
ncbi:hypothetical protein [Streptomyces glaucus]|uniref:Integral membrane protein n=1 Tax=Streptomyces glaucus TaxID=284029 RepID=A0ABN3K1F4_9ACTN